MFAYGQTGSGKTHTMQGPDIEDIEMQGIVQKKQRRAHQNRKKHEQFTLCVYTT